jgi:hypothetical protein
VSVMPSILLHPLVRNKPMRMCRPGKGGDSLTNPKPRNPHYLGAG